MRHTAQPLTAGDWHGFPVLFERALQRKAWCMASFEEEGSVVDHLGAQHAFHRVLRIDTDLPSQSAERTLDGRRRHRTAGLRERARQLRRQVLVPLVMPAAAESAELSSPSRRVYAELGHTRGGT